jgi:hypothetical protein
MNVVLSRPKENESRTALQSEQADENLKLVQEEQDSRKIITDAVEAAKKKQTVDEVDEL